MLQSGVGFRHKVMRALVQQRFPGCCDFSLFALLCHGCCVVLDPPPSVVVMSSEKIWLLSNRRTCGVLWKSPTQTTRRNGCDYTDKYIVAVV